MQHPKPILSTDRFLFAELRRGTMGAFDEIFRIYYSAVCYFANQLVKDREVAKAVASKIFVLVWKNREIFNTKPELQSFLYVGAWRSCADYLNEKYAQGQYRNEGTEPIRTDLLEDHVLQLIFATEYLRELNYNIEKFPKRYRRVVKLSIDGMTPIEISQKLSIPRQIVCDTIDGATMQLTEEMVHRNMTGPLAFRTAFDAISHS